MAMLQGRGPPPWAYGDDAAARRDAGRGSADGFHNLVHNAFDETDRGDLGQGAPTASLRSSRSSDLQRLASLAAKRLKDLDLRFDDLAEEASFKASLESELLGWMLTGTTILSIFALFVIFEVEITSNQWEDEGDTEVSRARMRVLLAQLAVWTFVPAIFSIFAVLRVWFGSLRTWNWEVIVTGVMMYGSAAIVVGQKYYLTLLLGEHEATALWGEDISCSVEAWALLGLQSMTTAAVFFLPIRTIVAWLVPITGMLAYIVMKVAVDTQVQTYNLFLRSMIMVASSYLAWRGAIGTEKHIRHEWRAVKQVRESADTIQARTHEIEEKEAEIQATTDLVKSLQTVTRALCDTMVHLTPDLRIVGMDCHDAFFETSAEGRSFMDFLSRVDQERFADCVDRASESHIPVCIPVTLFREHSTNEVHLVIVDRGRPDSRYLLGIRVENDNPVLPQHMTYEPEPPQEQAAALPGTVGAEEQDGPPTALQPVPMHIQTIDEDAESDFSGPNGGRTSWRRLTQTTTSSKARTIRMVLKRWHVSRDEQSCCHYHSVVDAAGAALEWLRRQKCDEGWCCLKEQCPRCTCMYQGNHCAVCGLQVGNESDAANLT